MTPGLPNQTPPNASPASTAQPSSTPAWVDWRASGPADWTLAAIGLVTAIIAITTLRAIKKQVEANIEAAHAARQSAVTADKQLRLVNQQWLEFVEWLGTVSDASPEAFELDVRFEIENPTGMALTLTGIDLHWMDIPQSVELSFSHVLPPGQKYTVKAPPYFLTLPAQWAPYMTSELGVALIGQIKFIDAFGDARSQHLGRLCVARKDHPVEFRQFDGNLATHQLPPH